jgi:uncharacterized membrane protein YhaH (DUF805 family)
MKRKSKRKNKLIKEIQENVLTLVIFCSLLVGIIGFSSFIFGLSDATRRLHDRCNSSWHRWEYALPTYRIGCWLGEVPGEN